MTSVLIVDDHPFVIQGCRHLLEAVGVESILSANNSVTGYAVYQQNRPDVVVVDLSFGDDALAGLSLVRRIRSDDLQTRIIVVSMHDDPAIMQHCLKEGASGYVVKDACAMEFVKAVQGDSDALPFVEADRAPEIAACQSPARPI
jgi:two-component system, NarL family, invasion response regulator UvrY